MKLTDGMPTSSKYYSSLELLKSLLTSVEVNNLDVGFITVELDNWFAEFTKKNYFFLKSTALADFSLNKLDN